MSAWLAIAMNGMHANPFDQPYSCTSATVHALVRFDPLWPTKTTHRGPQRARRTAEPFRPP